MRIGPKFRLALVTMMCVVLSDRLPSVAQEPGASKGTTPAPVVKKKADPARRVPAYFGQIGLTPEQRASIYTLQAKHQEKIDALEQQIAAEKATMLSGCEAVLTETQKKLLGNLRQAAAEGPARVTPATAPAPATTPATPKAGN